MRPAICPSFFFFLAHRILKKSRKCKIMLSEISLSSRSEPFADLPFLAVSLKCGGVGLNLVRANRVISLGAALDSAARGATR
jgi:hypothetical protein